jgi:conjugal transfer mating pair stabilization protein TraN
MLFGRNQNILGILALALFFAPHWLIADQQSGTKEGKKFGKTAHAKGIKFEDTKLVSDLTPIDQKGKVFDAKQAKNRMKTKDIPSNEIYEFLERPEMLRYQEFKPDVASIKHSDSIVNQYEKGFVNQTESVYKIEKCLQPDAPFELSVRYTREITIKFLPEVKKTTRICNGHEKKTVCIFESRSAKVKEEIKKLSVDPTVKEYQVEKFKGSPLVVSKWKHHDDAECCDNSRIKEKISKSHPELQDSWLADNSKKEELAKTPNCTLIHSNRSNSGTKVIEGIEISRDSWEKIDTYMCRYEPIKCPFFGSYNCLEQGKQCKKQSGNQCALWEITFKCLSKNRNNNQIKADTNFGTNEEVWDTDYKPNTSFSDVVTKLKIFDEMKHEFEKSKHVDITQIQVFKGKKFQCSKSVAGDLMYDCCFSFHGLTNDLKLSKCTSDEIALSSMREKGLCYYIGSYKEKFIKLWTSRKEHVYCCFPTKLARVLQQEGRKQLGIDWGTPKKPNCRGFTQDEIQRLDFSKLDLSEAYDTPPPVDMTDKIHLIQERLKNRLQELEGEAK